MSHHSDRKHVLKDRLREVVQNSPVLHLRYKRLKKASEDATLEEVRGMASRFLSEDVAPAYLRIWGPLSTPEMEYLAHRLTKKLAICC